MKLINFFGVNCYLLCLINIAAKLDADYANAFAALWSETSFTHNKEYQIYISKRVFKGFKACGIRLKKTAYESIPHGKLFLVGMDTFNIPWSPVYQSFNGAHYFMAKKEKNGTIICFDPIYNEKYMRIKDRQISLHAFTIYSVTKALSTTTVFNIENEANEVLSGFPILQKELCLKLEACKNKNRKKLAPMIKQIIAMISNRYMFKKYLQNTKSKYSRFFNKAYFNKWQAIKNGLYKASIQKDNFKTIQETWRLLKAMLNKEMLIAAKIKKQSLESCPLDA